MAIWDFRKEEHRDRMGRLISPLIVASQTRAFATPETAKDQLIAWCMSLKDVPAELIHLAVERLMHSGVTWMPRPGDVLAACAEIRLAQRADAARQAKALTEQFCEACQVEHCLDCHGTGLREAPGRNHLSKCPCRRRVAEIMDAVGQPIALPAHVEESAS